MTACTCGSGYGAGPHGDDCELRYDPSLGVLTAPTEEMAQKLRLSGMLPEHMRIKVIEEWERPFAPPPPDPRLVKWADPLPAPSPYLLIPLLVVVLLAATESFWNGAW